MAITPRSFLRNPLLLIGFLALAIPAGVLAATMLMLGNHATPEPQRVVVKRVMVPVHSVPVQQVQRATPQRVAAQAQKRGWLGVRIATMTEQRAARLDVAPHTRGVLVQQVFDRMPAKRAGFRPGDIITHYNGKRVVTACAFKKRVVTTAPASHVRIRVLRDGAPMILSPVLAAAPDCGCKR